MTTRRSRRGCGALILPSVCVCVGLVAAPAGAMAQDRTGAIPPGLGFGGSVGINGFGGSGAAPIHKAAGWDFFLSGGLPNGLFLRGGLTLNGHDVPPAVPSWQFLSWYLEPRYVALEVADRFSPFVAVRAGRIREKAIGTSYDFHAVGWSYGGGGGLLVRVAPQIALEAGFTFARTRFEDYSFRGEFAWKDCLDHLEAGTGMPESLKRCAGSRSTGGVVRLCYPPYYDEGETGSCSPPQIPYPGSARSGSWLRTWIGVNLSLSTVLER